MKHLWLHEIMIKIKLGLKDYVKRKARTNFLVSELVEATAHPGEFFDFDIFLDSENQKGGLEPRPNARQPPRPGHRGLQQQLQGPPVTKRATGNRNQGNCGYTHDRAND